MLWMIFSPPKINQNVHFFYINVQFPTKIYSFPIQSEVFPCNSCFLHRHCLWQISGMGPTKLPVEECSSRRVCINGGRPGWPTTFLYIVQCAFLLYVLKNSFGKPSSMHWRVQYAICVCALMETTRVTNHLHVLCAYNMHFVGVFSADSADSMYFRVVRSVQHNASGNSLE